MQEFTADAIAAEQVASGTDNVAQTEQQLTEEIAELWAVHTDAQSIVKKSQQELKAIRQRLGENLFFMKQLLARPGRAGQWSSFLADRGISRTTADRLCSAHQKSLSPENGTSGAIPELTDAEITELAKSVWKKLKKKLGTKRAAYTFLGRLVAECGLGSFKFTRGDQHGIALVDPDAALTPQTTATTAAAPTNAA